MAKSREARNAATKKYRKSHPDKHRVVQRRHNLKRYYGLTLEAYDAMLAGQQGRCAVCLEKPNHTLAVDHDHQTGKVRGLLECAARYLERNADVRDL